MPAPIKAEDTNTESLRELDKDFLVTRRRGMPMLARGNKDPFERIDFRSAFKRTRLEEAFHLPRGIA
jgi:hypothetical protein